MKIETFKKIFGISFKSDHEDPAPPPPPKGNLRKIITRSMVNDMIDDLLLIRNATENKQLKELIQVRIDELCQYVLDKNKDVKLKKE